MEFYLDSFTISTDPARLDFEVIHGYLHRAYWSPGVPREVVEKAARHSLCFGVYEGEKQIGYARVISDYAVFAYLADVFILEAYRGLGLGKWLVSCVLAHPDLQNLRKWMLATRDAHGLYAQYGFRPLPTPAMIMEKRNPDPYLPGGTTAEKSNP